jgi:hypothetical protein
VRPDSRRLFEVKHHGTGLKRLQFAYTLYQEFEARGVSFLGSDIRIFLNISDYDPNSYVQKSLGSANFRVGFVQWDVGQFQNLQMWNLTKLIHEIGHTLGASDKYNKDSKSVYPEGYVQPEMGVGSKQVYAEIMSGTIPTGGKAEAEPTHPRQLRFGEVSAREMGWLL